MRLIVKGLGILGLLLEEGVTAQTIISPSSNQYGAVHFPTSCNPAVEEQFDIAMSKLYSFWYSDARKDFNAISLAEPDCCMSYWGAANTYNHPIWDFIEDDRLSKAENLSSYAIQCFQKAGSLITKREMSYIEAFAAYVNTSDLNIIEPAKRLQ